MGQLVEAPLDPEVGAEGEREHAGVHASCCRPSGCPPAAPGRPRGCARGRAPRRGSRGSRAATAAGACRGCSPGRARRGRPSARVAAPARPPLRWRARRRRRARSRGSRRCPRPWARSPPPARGAPPLVDAAVRPAARGARAAHAALRAAGADGRPRRRRPGGPARSCAARPRAGPRAGSRTPARAELLGDGRARRSRSPRRAGRGSSGCGPSRARSAGGGLDQDHLGAVLAHLARLVAEPPAVGRAAQLRRPVERVDRARIVARARAG